MLEFRRLLLKLRKQYLFNKPKFLPLSILSVVVFSIISLGIDFLLPWGSWGMVIRTIVLIPTAISIFVLGYSGVLAYHFYQSRDRSWTPLRGRYSPTWRQRISMIIGAVLLVLIYAIAMKPGYTLMSSAIIAVVIGLFVFMRKTSNEMNREELGIPDARDAALNTHLRRHATATRNQPESKAKSKADEKAMARIDKARVKLAKAEAEFDDSDAGVNGN